jgi:hypothetical protein
MNLGAGPQTPGLHASAASRIRLAADLPPPPRPWGSRPGLAALAIRRA